MKTLTITDEVYTEISQRYCFFFHLYDNPEYVVTKEFVNKGYHCREVQGAIEKFKTALLAHN